MDTTPMRRMSKKNSILFLLLVNFLFFALPIYLIVMGALNITDCPVAMELPIGMIVLGVLIIIERLLYWKRMVNETKFEKMFPRPTYGGKGQLRNWEEDKTLSTSKTIRYLLFFIRFLIVLLILLGFVSSFHIVYWPRHPDECTDTVVWSVFSISAVVIPFLVFALFGTLYVYFAHLISSFQKKIGSALNGFL